MFSPVSAQSTECSAGQSTECTVVLAMHSTLDSSCSGGTLNLPCTAACITNRSDLTQLLQNKRAARGGTGEEEGGWVEGILLFLFT